MAILKVPVTKAKAAIEIDTEELPQEVYEEALRQGLKVLVNRGTSKITKETYPVEEELRAKAAEVAEEQKANLLAGKIKIAGVKSAGKASGAVMTEARRLAKNIIKDEMKRQGLKVSHVEAKEITRAANLLLDSDQGDALLTQAKANIAERETVSVKMDLKSIISVSPTKVKAAEAKKAKAKAEKGEQLSAKQAGMVKARPKPGKVTSQPNA